MEITNITVSSSQKINHELYGGGAYESSDYFVSLVAEVDSNEDVTNVHKELKQATNDLIQTAIEDKISTFNGGVKSEVFYSYLRDLTARRPIDAETYNDCSVTQKRILQAVKKGIAMHKRDDASDKT